MTERAVVIAGAGPTGLTLAAELALAGVDVAVYELRPNQELAGSRAGGLHARTLEVFEQRGIADRFVSEGQISPAAGFAFFPLDLSDFPSRHNYVLGLWQNHIERILAAWVAELGVRVEYGVGVSGFAQDDGGVDVQLSDGCAVRAAYLVGCDGGRSLVRKTAGIDFPGWDPTLSNLLAEVEMADPPELGMRRDHFGVHGFSRVDYEIRDGQIIYSDSGPIRVMVPEEAPGATGEPTLRDLSEAMTRIYGTDYGLRSATWISRFSDTSRQAASYREKRILLAGDAAHVHSPSGGQGLNTGVQDAVNLGWKLAQVVRGTSPESLLDSYHAERHPVAARVLRNTMAQVVLGRTDERTDALREVMADILKMGEPRRRIAGMISGLDIHYDVGDGHPLLGRRMPDLEVASPAGPLRVSSLLHGGGGALVNFASGQELDASGWGDRVLAVKVEYGGAWELPVLGEVAAPKAVLIRPDGYVAWVGEGTDAGLREALTRWFGPPAPVGGA